MESNLLESFFNNEYMPHGHCYLWQPHILWTNVISDLLIAAAYFSIPFALILFAKKRKDIGYQRVFTLFSLFILLCGITHVFGIITIWHGAYGWHGLLKFTTAIVSIMTAIYLYKILPAAIKMPTPQQVAGMQKELDTASQERKLLTLQVEQQKLVQFMLDTMPIGACLLDKNFELVLYNESFSGEVGFSKEELPYLELEDFLIADNVSNQTFLNAINKKMSSQQKSHFKIQSVIYLIGNNKKSFPAEVTLVKENFGNQPHFVLTLNNLSEIELVKQQLIESHEKLERAVNATEDGVWEFDISKNTMSWSDAFSKLVGINELEAQHIDTWKSHIHPDHINMVIDKIEAHLKNHEKFSVEYLGRNQQSKYGWFNITGNTIFDAHKRPMTMSGSLRYIQDSKILEQKVAEKSELLNTIYEGANNGIWVVGVERNKEFRYLAFNRTASRRIGVKVDDVIGKTLSDLSGSVIPSAVVEKFRDNYQSCVDIKNISEYTEMMPVDNKPLWFQTTLYPIVDKNNEVVKIVGSSIDITPLKQVEHQLAESKQFLENIINSSVCGISLFDFQTQKVTRINQRFTDILGYNLTNIQEIDDQLSLYHPDDLQEISKHIELVIQSQANTLFTIQYRYRHQNGKWIWCNTFNTIIKRDENNNPQIMLTTFIDITEQNDLLQRLQESNSYLERFAMVASHDLQEPLRKISAFSDALSERLKNDYELDEESEFQLSRIKDASGRMRVMISDIMGLSQINTASLHKKRFELSAAIQYATEQLQLTIEETSTQILVTQGDTVLFADRSLIAQLLQNLFANAIKFRSTPSPIIEVSAQKSNSSTTLYIKDNGIGMDPKFCTQIFEPFRRLHSKDKYSGSGIGLAICKQICKVHEGRIECKSEVDMGTTFIITLPN